MIRNTAVNDISVKIGEELKLDVLLPDARQVMHQNISSTEWKKVWKRDSKSRANITHDRLNDSNGTLSIKEFTADDAGTYRVLGFEGEILITRLGSPLFRLVEQHPVDLTEIPYKPLQSKYT
uniref:Uncharacterized protein n=1 Tax=Cyprinus carpio TaxID=7962 RepID=A0A8C1UZM7_CYPCA